MDGSESEIVQNKQKLILATTCKCYIMKIKAVFQNAFKPKKPLAIQTFSKRRRQYRVCQ